MRYPFFICLLLLINCGNNKELKKEIPKTPTENKPVEFQFNHGLNEYMGKNIGITGFIFTDSIGDFLKQGGYVIFERPNCFECEAVIFRSRTDISVVHVEDTSYTNPYKGRNWKLVKISGVVDNPSELYIDRMELSEYSYPDYENSGFVPITDDYLKYHAKDGDLVMIEGSINKTATGYSEELLVNDLENTGLKAKGFAILKHGNAPNNASILPVNETKTEIITSIQDEFGQLIGNKKVKMFGVLDYNKAQPNHFTIQVEVIQPLGNK